MITSHYVYLLIHIEDSTMYIGKRSCRCLPEEDVNYMSSSKHLPKDKCDKLILETFDTSLEAVAYEIELHNRFDVAKNPKFYNRAKQTSTGFDRTGVPMPREIVEKQKKARLGSVHSEETKKKMRAAKLGKKVSEETKARMSKASKGRTPYWLVGLPKSEETKEKIRKGNLGKMVSMESRKKMSDSHKGKTLSLEHRRNLAKSGSIPVVCIETGIVYESAKKAALALCKKCGSGISKCAKGKIKSAYGFTWKYAKKGKK